MASSPKRIVAANHDGVLVLEVVDKRLTEEAQVDEWKEEMFAVIRDASPKGVVIDMRNVEYLTSIAIFPLISTRSVAEEFGATVVLCNLSPTVANVLTVCQVIVESREHARYLAMTETLEDALKKFPS